MPAQPLPIASASRGPLPRICPQLGLFTDPATRYGFPSTGNFCHKVGQPQSLEIEQQEATCLKPCFTECPIWQSNSTLPGKSKQIIFAPRKILPFIIGIILLLAVFILVGYPRLNQNQPFSFFANFTAPTEPATPSREPVSTTGLPAVHGATVTRAPTQTLTPSPTSTATKAPPTSTATKPAPTEGPYPGTPFGPASSYLLHVVAEGESLTNIASRYGTTPQVLLASNFFAPGRAMWAGDILVIMPGVIDPDLVARYQVIQLEQATSIESIADQHNISVNDLRILNSLGSDSLIPNNRILIVPVP